MTSRSDRERGLGVSAVSPWSDIQLFVGWLVLAAARGGPLYQWERAIATIEARARDLARPRCMHRQCRTCYPWGLS